MVELLRALRDMMAGDDMASDAILKMRALGETTRGIKLRFAQAADLAVYGVPPDVFDHFLKDWAEGKVSLSPSVMWCGKPECEWVCTGGSIEEQFAAYYQHCWQEHKGEKA